MSEQEFHGKEEEKEQEKTQEKGAEKHPGTWGAEKYRNDPVGGVVLALALIWAGIALFLTNSGIVQNVFGLRVDAWPLIWGGAGILVLLGVLVRLLVPDYRRPVGGTVILGFVLIGIALGQVIGWSLVWPIILVAIGVSVIVGVLTRKR
jgi:hypothetical protein